MAMAASNPSMANLHFHHQPPVFRTDSTLSNSSFASGGSSTSGESSLLLLPLPYTSYMEKRQLFLRSYQFSRKKSLADRIKSSLVRFRRILRRRLRSVRRLRRVVWFRLRSALFRRRRRFTRLVQNYHAAGGGGLLIRRRSGCSDSCFW